MKPVAVFRLLAMIIFLPYFDNEIIGLLVSKGRKIELMGIRLTRMPNLV